MILILTSSKTLRLRNCAFWGIWWPWEMFLYIIAEASDVDARRFTLLTTFAVFLLNCYNRITDASVKKFVSLTALRTLHFMNFHGIAIKKRPGKLRTLWKLCDDVEGEKGSWFEWQWEDDWNWYWSACLVNPPHKENPAIKAWATSDSGIMIPLEFSLG